MIRGLLWIGDKTGQKKTREKARNSQEKNNLQKKRKKIHVNTGEKVNNVGFRI